MQALARTGRDHQVHHRLRLLHRRRHVLVYGCRHASAGRKIGLFWPVAFHFLNSIAFAHLLPVSLALFAEVAPKVINATVIGPLLSRLLRRQHHGRLGRRLLRQMATTNFWLLHAAFAAGSGLCFLLAKFIAGHHLESEAG